MSTLEPLLLRLDTCAWRLGRGDLAVGTEIGALTDAVDAMAPSLGADVLERVHARLAAVHRAADNACSDLEDKIHQAQVGRRVSRAYASSGPRGR